MKKPNRFMVDATGNIYVEESDGRVFALPSGGFLQEGGLPADLEDVTIYTPAVPPKRTATAVEWQKFLRTQDVSLRELDVEYASRTEMVEWWEHKHGLRRMDPIRPNVAPADPVPALHENFVRALRERLDIEAGLAEVLAAADTGTVPPELEASDDIRDYDDPVDLVAFAHREEDPEHEREDPASKDGIRPHRPRSAQEAALARALNERPPSPETIQFLRRGFGVDVTGDTGPSLTADKVHLSEVRPGKPPGEPDSGPIGVPVLDAVFRSRGEMVRRIHEWWDSLPDDQKPPVFDTGWLREDFAARGEPLPADVAAAAASRWYLHPPRPPAVPLPRVGPPEDAAQPAHTAIYRVEGYSPRDGLAHGSLDAEVYACEEHHAIARREWLGGLSAYTCPVAATTAGRAAPLCGDVYDYRDAPIPRKPTSWFEIPEEADADALMDKDEQETDEPSGWFPDAPPEAMPDE